MIAKYLARTLIHDRPHLETLVACAAWYDPQGCLDNGLLAQLSPEHFKDEQLGRVWVLIAEHMLEHRRPDGLMDRIRAELGEVLALGLHRRMDAAGPPLWHQVPTMVRLLGEAALGERVAALATEGPEPQELRDLADRLQGLVAPLEGGKALWDQVFASAVDEAGPRVAISTGIGPLDEAVSIRPGHLVVVGGHPGLGKTSFLVQLAVEAARAGHKSVIASQEMLPREVGLRAAACVSGRPTRELSGDLSKLDRALQEVRALPLAVVSVGSAGDVAALVRAQEPALVVVDFLQVLKHPGGPRSSREERVAATVWELARLARDSETAIVLASQYNRQQGSFGAQRVKGERLPVMSDLRESGAIEQAASTVLLLARPEKADTYQRWGAPGWVQAAVSGRNTPPRVAVALKVEKQRHGAAGKLLWLRSDYACCRFSAAGEGSGSRPRVVDYGEEVPDAPEF